MFRVRSFYYVFYFSRTLNVINTNEHTVQWVSTLIDVFFLMNYHVLPWTQQFTFKLINKSSVHGFVLTV